MKSRYEECIEEWQPQFRMKSAFFKYRTQRRKYQDIFCIPIFIVLILLLISFSAYMIYHGYQLWKMSNFKITFFYRFKNLTDQTFLVWVALITLVVSNIVFLLGFFSLMVKYPEATIKLLVAVSVITLLGLSVYFFIIHQFALGAILMLIFIIYALALFCVFRQHFKTCVLIAKIVAIFFKTKTNMLWVTVAVIGLSCICVSILLLSFSGLMQMIAYETISFTFGQLFLLTHLLQYILLLYFIYYIATFLVSCSVSNWYFENSSYNIWTGLGWMMFNHLGSITFASLVITPLKIINTIADSYQKNTDNMCAQVSTCLLKPCLSMVEGLVKTLNRYSIITIAFTGQSFVAGAKSAAVIVFDNLKILSLLEGIESFYFLSFWLLSVIWSVGFGIIVADVLKIQDGVIFTTFFLIIVNCLISLVCTVTFTQTISSSFFFFLMQQKIKSYNYKIFNIDKKVKDYYKDFFIDNDGGTIQDSDDEVVVPKSRHQHKSQKKTNATSEPHLHQTEFKINSIRFQV